jgi:hypothetical protein
MNDPIAASDKRRDVSLTTWNWVGWFPAKGDKFAVDIVSCNKLQKRLTILELDKFFLEFVQSYGILHAKLVELDTNHLPFCLEGS